VRIEGDWEAPLNEGLLCEIGRFLPIEEQRQRINTPMVRRNGAESRHLGRAFDAIAAQLKPLADKGGKGIAAVASTRLPVEALSLFKQISPAFARRYVTSLKKGLLRRSARHTPKKPASHLKLPDALKKADAWSRWRGSDQ